METFCKTSALFFISLNCGEAISFVACVDGSPIVALVFWWCNWRQTQSYPPWVAWSLITCLPARRCSPFDCNGISSISCLLFRINERQWKQSSSPSSSSSSFLDLPAQPKQRPAVGLIISSNGRDLGPVCANTHRDGAGKGRRGGGGEQAGVTDSQRDEVSTNVSQRRPCLDGKLLLADALLFYNQRLLLRERCTERRWRGGLWNREEGRGPRKSWKGAWREERFSECHNNL